ncbi:hypothetical protein SAMN05444285_1633 [Draconibacterium orientale]|uniref:Uncharacterized protein n=1 Tax=Draconibacterium orientale TaxID=1168034 RepID=A0A1I0K022_9BACT|nr:hypothetical protein SAMN05444285_1633 [Draconibacterium orientale]
MYFFALLGVSSQQGTNTTTSQKLYTAHNVILNNKGISFA